ncbi:MAG: GNAT family N-acetyltransferase [Nitrospiraceae bacterium]|nr:GNAT family N-acetyltransferase [Nitrospiraceae bacterium]
MDDAITLVPAEPEDALAAAKLWVDAFHDKFLHALGQDPAPALEEWLQCSPGTFAHTTFARRGDDVLGCIQIYTAQEGAQDDVRAIWRIARRRLGLRRAISCMARFWVMDSYRIPKNELYVKTLSVDPAWRGHGIGARLLDYADAEARARGLSVVGLHVITENEGAIRFYERHGYRRSPKQGVWLGRWAADFDGCYKMTKCLTPERRAPHRS